MTSFRMDYFWPESRRAEPGDLLLGPNVVHRVLAVRPVESRIWHDRWRLEVERVGRRQEILQELDRWRAESIERFGECVLVETGTYQRGETPHEYAARHGLPITGPGDRDPDYRPDEGTPGA